MDTFISISKGCFVYKSETNSVNKLRKYEDIKERKLQLARHFLSDDITKQSFYKEYQRMWNQIEEHMESIQNANNSHVLKSIVDFVNRHKCRKDVNYILDEHALPTAAVLTGVSQPDHLKLFQKLADKLKHEVSCNVCILKSSDCPTSKHTLENMIYNFLQPTPFKEINNENVHISEKGRIQNFSKHIKRSECTMWQLKQWYHTSNVCKPKEISQKMSSHLLIVILPDLECVSRNVIHDFIEVLSSYCKELPFIVILGVATTTGIHDILSYQVASKIRLDTFQISSAAMTLYEVLEKIILSPKYAFHLSGKTLKFLSHTFFHYDYSFDSFVQNLKYCIMEHYNQGNAYALCCPYKDALQKIQHLSHEDLEDIRKQLSFRPFVENLQDSKRILAVLTDDTHLRQELKLLLRRCHIYFILRHIFLEFLYLLVHDLPGSPLGKVRASYYINTMNEDITKQAEYKECWRILNVLSKRDLVKKFKTIIKHVQLMFMKNKDNSDLWQECEIVVKEKFSKVEKLLDIIENDTIEYNNYNSKNQRDVALPSDSNKLTNITSRQDLRQKLQQMQKEQRLQINEYKRSVEELLTYVQEYLIKSYIKPEFNSPTLYELFIFSNIDEVKYNLIATPRCALHLALTNPHFYLQCACCELKSLDQFSTTLPDISIIYKLHLECGHMINIYDWLQAFHTVLRAPNSGNEIDKDNHSEQEEQINPQIQARFTRAIAELQFLGYIKMCKRKTDHATRLTW